MNNMNLLLATLTKPISVVHKRCAKHGIEYDERTYKHYVEGCPQCEAEKTEQWHQKRLEEQEQANRKRLRALADKKIKKSRIPKRFQGKTINGYEISTPEQKFTISRIKAYAAEFTADKCPTRSLVLLGNAGTGKTHLACAIGLHVINNCERAARFTSVSELNRLIRESKSYDSEYTESEIIDALASYDLLIIDEVGVQSGTDAESRAMFDVFNERYQQEKPTVLISNLDAQGFCNAVGDRIADRIKEDGGEVLLFNWTSKRGNSANQVGDKTVNIL